MRVIGGICVFQIGSLCLRGSLMASMLPRELKWEEVALLIKRNDTVESACAGKLQVTCKVPLVGNSPFGRCYINA